MVNGSHKLYSVLFLCTNHARVTIIISDIYNAQFLYQYTQLRITSSLTYYFPSLSRGINSCRVPIYYTWVERDNCGQNAMPMDPRINALSKGIRTEWDSNPRRSDYVESSARTTTTHICIILGANRINNLK